MVGFRCYLEGHEEDRDISGTLSRIPERHREFLKGFSLSFQGGSTINNDGKHVGVVQSHPNPHITIAAPYRYSREMVLLHEVAHLVWVQLMDHHRRQAWTSLVAKTPMKEEDRQDPEELWAMAYAATYAKHPPTTYHKPEWVHFIRQI